MLILGLLTSVLTLHPHFRTPQYRPVRAAMFVALGGSSVIPVFHGIFLYSYAALDERMGLSWIILEGVLYVTGAGIYAARFPERSWPGRFDIWGSSHQVFHCFVVAAAA